MPKPPTAYDQSGTQFAYGLNAAPGAPLNTELMAWRELLMRQELITATTTIRPPGPPSTPSTSSVFGPKHAAPHHPHGTP